MAKRSKETIGEWRARKRDQARFFMERDPSLSLDYHGDYETRFVLVHPQGALRIGQLPRRGQPSVDLTHEEIAQWANPLRKARQSAAN